MVNNKINYFTSSYIFSILILSVLLSMSAIAGNEPVEDQFQPGMVLLKIYNEFKPNLQDGGYTETGIPQLDRFMSDIDAHWIDYSFPGARPPIPGGADITRIYTMYFPEDADVLAIAGDLERMEIIEYAEPHCIYQLFLDHNDPDRDRQYALDLMEVNEAHDITTGSSEVVIAISDNGTDWHHEDLADNIWINPGEDLNGNGVIDENEENGEDDDDNGYIDDFYGWDFPEDDNDPNTTNGPDIYSHGTHVAGIVSAVTNNETGISSVGYSCRLMIVRAGIGQQIPNGYESIRYAAENGADVINCSWGGGNAGAGQDVVEYAHDQGSLVVAAAGNSNNNRRLYPAGFETVVAIAATDSQDRKAGFSSYGDWVDLSAPGNEIYSTKREDTYGNMSGTSMASPYVAGIAGLIKSEYPEMTNEVIRLFLRAGVDDISEQNPNRWEQLGTGRINAFRALRAVEHPILEMSNFVLSQDGNANDRVDVGEEVEFSITLSNFGRDAEEIMAVISTEDDEIEFISSEVEFPDIGAGGQHTNNDNPFIFTSNENMIAHTVTFRVTFTAQPDTIELVEEYDVLVGHPAVLIVDDDDGGDFQEMYADAVSNLNMGYLLHNVLNDDRPQRGAIVDHQLVIWVTGNAPGPLNRGEMAVMRAAIEEGANVLLVGKWIGDARGNAEFLSSNFGVYHDADSVVATTVVGMPGERPIPQDVEILLSDPDNPPDSLYDARNSASRSRVRTIDGADTMMVYMHADTVSGVAAIHQLNDDTGAHTVYIGFSLELATDLMTPPTLVVAQILDWMLDYQSTPIMDDVIQPTTMLLNPAFPNPFNSSVRLSYTVPINSFYELAIFNTSGQQVDLIHQGNSMKGWSSKVWEAKNVPSGLYFARLTVPGLNSVERKLILTK